MYRTTPARIGMGSPAPRGFTQNLLSSAPRVNTVHIILRFPHVQEKRQCIGEEQSFEQ